MNTITDAVLPATQSGMTVVLQGHSEKTLQKAAEDATLAGFTIGAVSIGMLWALDHWIQVDRVTDAQREAERYRQEAKAVQEAATDAVYALKEVHRRLEAAGNRREEVDRASTALGAEVQKLRRRLG